MAFLADTCAWIDVERGLLSAADLFQLTRGESVFISPVVLAELRAGVDLAADAAERERRLTSLARLEGKPELVINATTGLIFGQLAAGLYSLGRPPRQRVQDLWLASQAIQYRCTFLTRNAQDFADLPGLQLACYRLQA